MKILVTGASGFLGTFLCNKLEDKGHDILGLNSTNCDLTDERAIFNLGHDKYDLIFHLAAWTQAGDFCLRHPGEQWIINQKINTHLLTWWQACQPQAKLIAMGTSCSYSTDRRLKEENYLSGQPIDSLFSYAMTKRMLYAGLIALNRQYHLRYLCVIPSTLYGPGYHTDGRQMHFIFDLIRKIIRGKLYGKPVILWGDGRQRRELVYIEDFVDIMLRLNDCCENDIINIGSGKEYSIRHFARRICEIVEYDFDKIVFDTERYVGAKSKCLAIDKLLHYIPNPNMTDLDIGLEKTIQWFRQNQAALL
ncbi:NAD-dependent epimerase/dehydratase family protein [Desulfosarcina ovata]|uniref:GDP-L-fucose synthase n=1 Tax=Desulfosarcina ovata subsp. ovata TaxID=2752305 RepID=A0A5K8A2X6_9BACT|nr:NAD-dependent epimerase/dehydratase family protein [Desulfosarcina ovata]BBO86915.1 GDP-L-fucose synthase [Desulfosarcina ovata subsp. ovata]